MRYRRLGRTGIEVSEISYGAWGIGGNQWRGASDDESAAALKRALELGLNFIDTALAYGEGHSERLIARIVPANIAVATKVPPKNRLWPARPGIGIKDVFPYDYVMRSTEESLRNLKRDSVDLQQLHVWNPEWIDADEWRRALEDLKKTGKAKNVGISINDHQPDSALELIRTGLVDTVQVIYNVFDQSPETNLFPLARKMDIGVLARVPLDEGALSGTLREDTRFDERDFRAWYFRGERLREAVRHASDLMGDLGIGAAELPAVALRFCLANPAVSCVIPGMRRVRNVEANCAVSEAGSPDQKTMEILKRHAWPKNYYC